VAVRWLFKRKPKCDLCGVVLGEGAGTLRYRVADQDEVQEMSVCKQCGDKLDRQTAEDDSPGL
jgi:hypothetical protein